VALDYKYSYFVGALLFLAAWMALYAFRPAYRAQMLWGSLLSSPFALTGFLFIPQYWNPPSLWNLDARFGISIEDVIWSASVGGIAAVASEIVFNERLVRSRSISPVVKKGEERWVPLVIIVVSFLVLHALAPQKSIYDMIVAFFLGVATVAYLRHDLISRMLRGAVVFTVFYVLLFAYFIALFPEFVSRFYNVKNLLGRYLLGIPVEEVMFAYSGGMVWCVIYEYMQSYRLASVRPLRFVKYVKPESL
jgi:hypothetical protein